MVPRAISGRSSIPWAEGVELSTSASRGAEWRPFFLEGAHAFSAGVYSRELILVGGVVADIHITQDMLDSVFRGELPPRVLAEVGARHLLALCPHCRGEFETWQQRRSGAGDSDSALRLLPVLLEEQTARLEKQEDAAERDLRDLLRLSFEDRLNRIRRAFTRFRGATLAHLLLERARKLIPAEPRVVYELAETAQAVLRYSVASPGTAALSVRAAVYSGNALRAQSDLQAADARFAFARGLITYNGVTDTLVYAEVDWFEGTLRKDQRRFAEAEALLLRSVMLYRLAGDPRGSVSPLVTLGILYYHRQDYRQALDTFQGAISQLLPETDPRFFCSVHHNLTLTLCELGDHHAAAEALETSRELYQACPDGHTQARLAWVEGKIASGFGHLARAEEAFLAVRRGFIEEGNGYDVAMVSLDLALVYAKQGRTAELKQLAEEMHAVFESQEIHREAHAALLLFHEAARAVGLTVERVDGFIRYFKKARVNPGLRFGR
jgi:tetratricopeptide (TPR) repeat protein